MRKNKIKRFLISLTLAALLCILLPPAVFAAEAGSLSIASCLPGYDSGEVVITLDSPAGLGNFFVYMVTNKEISGVTTETTITDGKKFKNGATAITVNVGQYVTIYEIESDKHVVNYVCKQITENTGTETGDYIVALSAARAGHNTAAIIKYVGSGGAVTIPEQVTVDGTDYTVTAIANGISGSKGAFSGKTAITSLDLPASLTSIGNYAFYGCSKLTSLTIPDGVTAIGDSVFASCSVLTAVTIGSGVTDVGTNAFYLCKKLNSAFFIGPRPAFGETPFSQTSADFTVYYRPDQASSWLDYKDYPISVFYKMTLDPNFAGTAAAISFAAPDGANRFLYPAYRPAHPDHAFNGWYNDAACEHLWDPSAVPATGDITLYAAWTPGMDPGSLSVTSATPSPLGGETVITLGYTAGAGNSFVYKVGDTPVCGLTTADTVTDGTAFTSGSTSILVEARQYVTIYEITAAHNIVNYVCRQVAAGEIRPGFNIDGLNYVGSGDTASVTGYTGSGGAVEIPSTVSNNGKAYTVTAIADGISSATGAFYNGSKTITSVTLPNTIATIGDYAFSICRALTSINIPDGVTTIGDSAFSGCSKLPSVTIPDSVTGIGNSAFNGCNALTTVTIPSSVTSIGNSAFSGCAGLTSVMISDSVASIGNYAFNGCSALSSVTIPDSVASIGNYAFKGCSALSSATIPDSVVSIGDSAFSGCSALSSVTIPDSVASIGRSAFSGCSGLAAAYFMGDMPAFGTSIATPFAGTAPGFTLYYHVSRASSWTGFTAYTARPFCVLTLDWNFSESTPEIKFAAIRNNGCLESTPTAPNRNGYIFNGWYKDQASANEWDFITDTATGDLTLYAGWGSGTPAGSLTITGVAAASSASGATAITLADTAGAGNSFVCKVSDRAVFSVTTDATVTDGAPFTSGADIPVAGGQYVTIYEIDDASKCVVNYVWRQIADSEISDLRIGDMQFRIFDSTATLTAYTGDGGAVVIPGTVANGGRTYTVTAIADGASQNTGVFYSARSTLTSVTLPDSLQKIGAASFASCSELSSINIPSGLTSIGDYAFYSCTGLSGQLNLPDSANLGKYSFSKCSGLNSLNLPSGMTGETPEGVFAGCSGLTSLNIPNGVTSIGQLSFLGLKGVRTLTIPDSVRGISDSAFDGGKYTSVKIGSGVESIGIRAFCSDRLTSVTIPANVKTLDEEAFCGCLSLKSVYFLGTTNCNKGTAFIEKDENPYQAIPGLVLYYKLSDAFYYLSALWNPDGFYVMKPFCELTLDPNYSDGVLVQEYAAITKGHIEAPAAPDRAGYTFDGWYEEADCLNAFDFANTTITGDLTLYAHWLQAASYTVTTDSAISGGRIAVDPASAEEGTLITVSVIPDPPGKQLAAGSLKYTADGGLTYTPITAIEGVYRFVLPAANVIVTAQFEDIPDKTPPVLNSDTTDNRVGQAVEITFADDDTWRNAISEVRVSETALTSGQYTISAGKITIVAGVFTAPGDYTVTVTAGGYSEATVTQRISEGTAEQIDLTVGTVTGNPGEVIEVPITLTSSGEAAGGQFNLSFDSSLLTYKQTVIGNDIALSFRIMSSQLASGDIRVMYIRLAPVNRIPVGTVVVATMQFEVAAAASPGASCALELAEVKFSDGDGTKLPITVNNGQFSVFQQEISPPALTADTTDNRVGQAVEITFADDETWRNAISEIRVNETALTGGQYTISAGKITIAAGVFTAPGDYTVTVTAGGYSNATVTQTMNRGAAEELEEAKIAAKNALDTYKNPADYRQAQQTELAIAIAAGKSAIDNAADTAAVDNALAVAKAVMDNIKTDARLTAEEQAAALAEAKSTAKNELANYKNPNDYREAQQAELTAAINNGNDAINAAADINAVNSALAAAKTELDKIKTDAQLRVETVDDLIAKIGDPVTLADKKAIGAARAAYNALTEELKKQVKNPGKLEAAEAAYEFLQDGQVSRIAGGNRYDTSAKTALQAYPDGAKTVIIARGDDQGNFADALAASYLAGLEKAPILLVSPGSLPQEIEAAIKKLGAQKAYVLGGELAVSKAIESKLKTLGLQVERITGANRYATAAAIAAKGGPADTAIVVSGFAPADSLVAGPLAFSNRYPILLVDKNSVPAETKKAIADLGIKKIIVIGGENAVSKAVYDELPAKERYSGQSRIETSLVVAEKSFTEAKDFSIVGYLKLADAVGAAVSGNPIIYVKYNISDVDDYLTGATAVDTRFIIFGGTLAVNNTVEKELKELVQ